MVRAYSANYPCCILSISNSMKTLALSNWKSNRRQIDIKTNTA